MVIYGAIAALGLFSLWLVSLSPLIIQWGRELTAAAIALISVLIGVMLRERRPRSDTTSVGEASATPIDVAATLSPREREIARLLGGGYSNKELARQLNVSENTIKTHLANLYAKLGVRRRVEAVVVAQHLGVMGDHPKITRQKDGDSASRSDIVASSPTSSTSRS